MVFSFCGIWQSLYKIDKEDALSCEWFLENKVGVFA